ncbi:MAG: hypothetical protein H0U85_00330 [Gemmatimonadales bacterium]|nr:hypothetical protein [Gemmatimonadales bacterium]
MTGWQAAAIGWHLASRVAYVGGVGWALARQESDQIFTRAHGVDAGFRSFRRIAAILMNNDAVSFALLCLATWRTLHTLAAQPAVIAAGVGLIVVGVSVKVWAARTLGAEAYYWHDFFAPGEAKWPDPPGPYRLLRNPMYTIGYLHAYGIALVCGSAYGIAAAGFDQAAILLFHHVVERPHVRRLLGGTAPRA